MKTKTSARHIALVVTLCAVAVYAQLLDPPSSPPQPPAGCGLNLESRDLRSLFLSKEKLNIEIGRGKIFWFKGKCSTQSPYQEVSTNEWKTIADVLKAFPSLYDPKSEWGQVRIIQRDSILQSSFYQRSDASNGFDPLFLQRKLEAGDIVFKPAVVD